MGGKIEILNLIIKNSSPTPISREHFSKKKFPSFSENCEKPQEVIFLKNFKKKEKLRKFINNDNSWHKYV